jgi:hypothetical protein
MSDSIFPKRPGSYSYAEQARGKFEDANNILKEANRILTPILPSKETLEQVSKLRSESDKLISLLEAGINKDNINKIDEAARNVGRISLNIQQLTIKYRVDK